MKKFGFWAENKVRKFQLEKDRILDVSCSIFIFFAKKKEKFLVTWADFQQPLLSHFSFLGEFLNGKVPVYNRDGRVLRLVNLTPG